MEFCRVGTLMKTLGVLAAILLLAGCSAEPQSPEAPTPTSTETAETTQPEKEVVSEPEETLASEDQAGDSDPESEPEPTQSATGTATATATPKPTQTSNTPTKTATPSPSPSTTQTQDAQPQPTASTAPGGISRAEVAKNNTRSKCWVIVDGSVHDLTRWINQHPGGASAIVGLCGTDASDAFSGQHGGQARPSSVLDGYFIGPLSD